MFTLLKFNEDDNYIYLVLTFLQPVSVISHEWILNTDFNF